MTKKVSSKEVQYESCGGNQEREKFQRPEEMKKMQRKEDGAGNKGKWGKLMEGKNGGKRKTEETFFFLSISSDDRSSFGRRERERFV